VFLDTVSVDPAFAVWCDRVGAPPKETCPDTIAAALDAAAADLAKAHGPAETGWAWGPIHAARFKNLIWSGLPFVGDSFTVTTPFGGDSTSVNVARNRHTQRDYHTVHAAGLRMVVDFADLNASRFIIAPGQSGHPRSPHYADLAQLWGAGLSIEIRDDWGRDAPPAGAQKLTLAPSD
jgi:penicillin amidase